MKFVRNGKTIYHLVTPDGATIGEISRDRSGWRFHYWPQWGHHIDTDELRAQAYKVIKDQTAILTVTERLLK